MTAALAIDLGGTKVEAALVDDAGVVDGATRVRAETGAAAAADPSVLRDAVDHVVRECLGRAGDVEVVAAGVGAAGPVDLGAGTISPVNLPAVRDFPVVELVRAASGLEDVTLRLDGTCIALAELWLGAARGVRDAVVFVVSTGIGGGIVSDGRLVAGASGNAGHLGQVVVERVGADVAAATVEGIGSGPHSVAWARAQGWVGSDGEELAASFRAGDPIAIAAVDRSARAVGAGLANASTLLDLELAVVGGGFSFVADDYAQRVEDAAHAHSVNAFARRLRVVRARLGGDAPLVGAAALVHRADLLGA
ncbi:ROK family protein [Microbacterium sp.]|uniref:ROK family protein n=1 Tax=Microbacterium sp. TaxID=51671 RepID=UPI0039E70468